MIPVLNRALARLTLCAGPLGSPALPFQARSLNLERERTKTGDRIIFPFINAYAIPARHTRKSDPYKRTPRRGHANERARRELYPAPSFLFQFPGLLPIPLPARPRSRHETHDSPTSLPTPRASAVARTATATSRRPTRSLRRGRPGKVPPYV